MDEIKAIETEYAGVKFRSRLEARCLKHRWRGTAGGKSIYLTFKGGIGVYDYNFSQWGKIGY